MKKFISNSCLRGIFIQICGRSAAIGPQMRLQAPPPVSACASKGSSHEQSLLHTDTAMTELHTPLQLIDQTPPSLNPKRFGASKLPHALIRLEEVLSVTPRTASLARLARLRSTPQIRYRRLDLCQACHHQPPNAPPRANSSFYAWASCAPVPPAPPRAHHTLLCLQTAMWQLLNAPRQPWIHFQPSPKLVSKPSHRVCLKKDFFVNFVLKNEIALSFLMNEVACSRGTTATFNHHCDCHLAPSAIKSTTPIQLQINY